MAIVSAKMQDLTRIVEDTRRLGDVETKVDEVEVYMKDNLTKQKFDLIKLTTKLKVQQLMIEAIPKKTPEDDPEYKPFNNFEKLVIGKR